METNNKKYGLQIDEINELIKIFEKKYFKYFKSLNFLNSQLIILEKRKILKIYILFKTDIIQYSVLNNIKLNDRDIKDLFIHLIEKTKQILIEKELKEVK